MWRGHLTAIDVTRFKTANSEVLMPENEQKTLDRIQSKDDWAPSRAPHPGWKWAGPKQAQWNLGFWIWFVPEGRPWTEKLKGEKCFLTRTKVEWINSFLDLRGLSKPLINPFTTGICFHSNYLYQDVGFLFGFQVMVRQPKFHCNHNPVYKSSKKTISDVFFALLKNV